MTAEIAIRMFPQRIVALDIDGELLAACKRRVDRLIINNQKYEALNKNVEIHKTISEFPIYFHDIAQKAGNKIISSDRSLEIIP